MAVGVTSSAKSTGHSKKTYVAQVASGREVRVAEQLQKQMPPNTATCYVPQCTTMRKKDNSWIKMEKVLFTGYVFIESNNIGLVAHQLKNAGGIARGAHLLCQENGEPLCVRDEELAWIVALANNVSHTVDMSEGVIEGDEIRIVSGPLKGHEALIRKINRHKRLALVEMQFLGRSKTVRLGLEVVSKR